MTQPQTITAPARPSRDGDDVLTRAAFERHPFGLLVTRAGGVVVAANAQAAHVLGREDLAGRRCCALLGCRTPGTSLADRCLTEDALAAGRPLPEVRLDLVGGDAARAVWVTASALTGREVLLHLRPGRPGDRRRRSDAEWTAGPQIRIHVLGRPRIYGLGGPLDGPWLRQRPGLLLKLLVANRRRLTHSEQLAHAFWTGADRRALQNVRYWVDELRGKLEPDRAPRQPSSFVTAHDGGYGLDLDRVRVDADEFERRALAGLEALARGERAAGHADLEQAVERYRGEFLADEPYADWAFAERDRLHELACQALEALAELALDAGRQDVAIQRLQRLAELEPLDQGVSRRLIGLLFEQGRSGEALRRYKQVQVAWQHAFGEELGFDVASLRRAARAAA